MQTTRILIVEDEALIAEDLRDRLEHLGHTVAEIVDTAEEAIAIARQDPPGLILMDIRLRGEGDGIDAATLIGERLDVPIVFMTAHSDADTIARAMLTRPYGYVVKPVRDADLITAIQTALLRHAAEERLRACETQTLEILENTADLILQIVPDGRILTANPACRTALGYSPSQLSRLVLTDLVVPDDRATLKKVVWWASEGKAGDEIVVTFLTKDGRRVPAKGVIGQRRLGRRLDRLWAVFHPVGAGAPGPGAGGTLTAPGAAPGDDANGHPAGAVRMHEPVANPTP